MAKSKKYFVFGLLAFLFLFNRLELFDPLSTISFSKAIYDKNDQLLRLTLSDDQQYRLFTKLDSIPSDLQKAILLSEDKYFYSHPGINPISLFRAVLSLNQQRPFGASTITMQMVRLRDHLYTKSFSGKTIQIFKALLAELLYSKKQILEAYLNLTPYGANIEGVDAASLIFFNKPVQKLNVSEMLALAVIPQNPIKRSFQKNDLKNLSEAKERLTKIWFQIHLNKKVDTDVEIPVLNQRLSELPFLAPHFVNYVSKEFDKNTDKQIKSSKLKTTLNIKIQKQIEKKISDYIDQLKNRGITNSGILLLNSKTHEIESWVGSENFLNEKIQGQNDAITTARSPGSALKPFTYALALDEGLIHPQSILYDTPSSFGLYDPENFDKKFKGPLSAEEALIQSRNVPAIYLSSRLKRKSLYQILKTSNVPLAHDSAYYGVALTLGAAEISPLKLAELYSALVNDGRWYQSKYMIENQSHSSGKYEQLFSPEASYMVLDMLKKNPRSESMLIDDITKDRIDIAWKTGTSYGYRDAWVIGIFSNYVLVVWLGNFDNSPNPALVGREVAAPLMFQIIDMLVSKGFVKKSSFYPSLGTQLKQIDVCSVSGGLPTPACQAHKKTWFFPGVSPIDECLVHRQFLVNQQTGKRVCKAKNLNRLKKETFEFWPSDIIQLFQREGIPYKKIPEFESECNIGESVKFQPEIILPKLDVKYSVLFTKEKKYESIPFKAKVDPEIKKIFWFANQVPLGEVNADETLFASLSPGQYEITVVDDHGQTSHRLLIVQLANLNKSE